jgi:prepilin-type N-terminal cleavage/methylation domain-containing protein
MKKKSGFTLTEVIVVVAVVGTIAAMLVPMLGKTMPNKEQVMAKKAYAAIDKIVNELKNDEDFYPEVDEGDTGFSNTNSVVYHGRVFGKVGAKKFCELFADKIGDIKGNIACNQYSIDTAMPKGQPAGYKSFTTNDRMVWVLPYTTFPNDNAVLILFDVNGEDEPNCFSYYSSSVSATLRCDKSEGPDRFAVKVDKYGQLYTEDKVLDAYIKRNDTNKDYEEVIKIEKIN